MTKLQKSFNILAISLNVLRNYFDGPQTKLFSDLYLTKFLDTWVKSFFLLCVYRYQYVLRILVC